MRNLKRVLALALALIMTLGLMITASAASYADADQIDANYGEAIEVLTNMGVFRGQANGGESTEFAPKDILTRAEAATLVYRLLTADVTDAKKSNYDYTSFDDVKEGEWWTGYITYAANGKYVVGYGNGKFGPNDQVTGIEVLTIMLRALGYGQNGEFIGGGWKDHVLTTANENGMLKGVATDDLDKGASRELVAQLLFNAITVPSMVNYAPLTGYTKTAQTLGNKNFGLVEINGVVTANEYADLYDDEPLAAGKTEINGVTYNTTTTLDDIGETHRGWATGKTVLYFVKTGTDTIFEAGYEIASKKFEDTVGLDMDDAEKFLNFSGSDTYTSDYRIEYTINIAKATLTEAEDAALKAFFGTKNITDENGIYTCNKTIKAGAIITAQDVAYIKDIFEGSDSKNDTNEYYGEVYVGTKSGEGKDISDRISFKTFKADYLEEDATYAAISANENGNWLKVIDNDGDGKAEYVLKTVYTMAQVDKISKKGDITLDVLDVKLTDGDSVNEIDKDIDVVTEDELTVGDIVYYAVIDGNAQTYLADMVTAKIDKVNRNTLTATTTDGDEYVQSGVHGTHIQDGEFGVGVRNLVGKTSYDLYFDKFGYLAVYTQTATSGNFVLITDGAYDVDVPNSKTGDYYVEWYNEGEFDTAEVDKNGAMFIDKNDTRNNSWGALRENDYNTVGKVLTTVAALAENGDGTVTLNPVENVFNKKTVRMINMNDVADMRNAIPGKNGALGTIYVSDDVAYEDIEKVDKVEQTKVEVRGLTTTTYYYVYPTKDGYTVKTYEGVNNLPKLSVDDEQLIEDVYAVGTQTTRVSGLGDGYYFTADVVVVEFSTAYKTTNAEQVFIYDFPVIKNNVTEDEVSVIRADGNVGEITVDLRSTAATKYDGPGLYWMWESDKDGLYIVQPMTAAQIAKEKYAIGFAATSYGTGAYDYAEVSTAYQSVVTTDVMPDGIDYDTVRQGKNPEFALTANSQYYTLSYDTSRWTSNTKATLKSDDLDYKDVLNELVTEANDITGATKKLNNMVLVSYDKNDNVVYAVSFAHVLNKDATSLNNYAYDVWYKLLDKEPVPDTFSVEFYGVADGDTKDKDSAANVIEVTYEQAKADGTGLVITGEKNVVKPVVTLSKTAVSYSVTIEKIDGTQVTYTLVQQAAQTGTTLTGANTAGTIAISGTDIQVANGTEVTVADLEALLDASQSADVDNSDRAAIVKNANGTFTVTNEAENSFVTYTVVYGSFVTIDDRTETFYANGTEVTLPEAARFEVVKNGDDENPTYWTGRDYQITSDVAGQIKFTSEYSLEIDDSGVNNTSIKVTWNAKDGDFVQTGDEVVATVTLKKGLHTGNDNNPGSTITITGSDSTVTTDHANSKVTMNTDNIVLANNIDNLDQDYVYTFTWTVGTADLACTLTQA